MTNEKKVFLGIDIGSVSVKLGLLNQNKEILLTFYKRSCGRPVSTFLELLSQVDAQISLAAVSSAAFTGSGARQMASLLDIPFYNEILTQYRAAMLLEPEAASLIDIGGQDSKLILLEKDPKNNHTYIKDFSMNTICAAGTGSFLDQQAQRLGISIEEEFGALALKSKSPPRIAGRCSVFAKTDMIHLQQEATPAHDIVAGLCFALARGFRNNIAKFKKLSLPVSFQGGVAANQGMRRALGETLGLNQKELLIPAHYSCSGAIGAALIARESEKPNWKFKSREAVKKIIFSFQKEVNWLEGLPENEKNYQKTTLLKGAAFNFPAEPRSTFLGIDVGSISTNLAVIDNQGQLIEKKYLMTAGQPLKAVQEGLRSIYANLGKSIRIHGVGTTGSGRYLTADFIGADQVNNEITAQAKAASFYQPQADTIFEIGGQDSKYISLQDKTVIDFQMNKVCAAGTGSFLEEQAQRLKLNIKDEFSQLALKSKRACSLGERCTVFMESNLVWAQQQGAEIEELAAGLSYSIATNYLNRVVENRKIGQNILFQGGVAYNLGVVAAFEKILAKKITIPPHHEVTGAIGAALIAKEKANSKTKFKGFLPLINSSYKLDSFECRDCPNQCKVKTVEFSPKNRLYYGSRCEKFEIDKKKNSFEKIPDFFAERNKRLLAGLSHCSFPKKSQSQLKIGIPLSISFYELLPLWTAFFKELGIEIILSDKTNKDIISAGTEKAGSETCFPIKVCYGHIMNLLQKGVTHIFIPTLINMPKQDSKFAESANCPYVQSLSYMAKSVIDFKNEKVKLLNPEIALGWQPKINLKSLINFALSLGADKKTAKSASQKSLQAQNNFANENLRRGKEILSQIKPDQPIAVIVGRPYNSCDEGINLNLGAKLRNLGLLPLPLDYLDLGETNTALEYKDMYWSYGQKILAAAKIISRTKNLLPVYVTNFGCGPDSFITHFFENEIKNKPSLQLEFDEHTSDVGIITRCEAFTDSFKNRQKEIKKTSSNQKKKKHHFRKKPLPKTGLKKDFKIYIPRMGDYSFILEAVFRRCGYPAEVFPESNPETLYWGRKFTSGKECYPCIVTTGDMVRITRKDNFEPENSAFFMPSTNGPCRFGQYNRLQRLTLDKLGFKQTALISPNQGNNLNQEMSFIDTSGYKAAWQGVVSLDFLYKLKHKIRPYEAEEGSTDKTYTESLALICQAIKEKKSLTASLKKINKSFFQIRTRREPPRPLIGIIGEIFVRNNSFCNKNIIKQIETLGGEVWASPVAEWLSHITKTLKLRSKFRQKYLQYLKVVFAESLQKKYEHDISAHFKDLASGREEPDIKTIWKKSQDHLPAWFGEAALGAGKAKDLYQRGASGVIAVMPFSCLPGNILSTVLNSIKKECPGFPVLVIDYDSCGQTDVANRLEAFIYQAKQNQKTRLQQSHSSF